MEELTDFIIDVFSSLWQKFKINAFPILAGGIIFSFFLIPYMYKIFPVFSLKYALLRLLILLVSFIFIKIFILTVKEIKINFNTVKAVFFGLGTPFIFTMISVLVLGVLAAAGLAPFFSPGYAEKFIVLACIVSAVAGIAVLALLPMIIVALTFTYEGNSIKEAVLEANKVFSYGPGKIYFLTVFLLLAALVLNLTRVGMIIMFPLLIMSMAQARESLIKIRQENDEREEKVKQKKSYRPKADFTKDYPVNEYYKTPPAFFVSGTDSVVRQEPGILETAPENADTEKNGKTEKGSTVKPGLRSVFQSGNSGEAPSSAASEAVKTARQSEYQAEEDTGKEENVLQSGNGGNVSSSETSGAAKTVSQPEYKTEDAADKEENVLQSGNGGNVSPAAVRVTVKTVSQSEYKTEDAADKEENEHISLSDIIDFGIYDKKESSGSKSGYAASESGDGTENNIEIEFESAQQEEDLSGKTYKTGKEYIDTFGAIQRKPAARETPEEKQKRISEAKAYIDNFGIIKKKK